MSDQYRDMPNLLRKLVSDYLLQREALKECLAILKEFDDVNTYRISDKMTDRMDELQKLIEDML